jgi:transcriptional regulator with XRE-family HTH domain
MAGGSPTLRGRELGARLRRLRLGANLKIEDVAEQLICSQTKVSRMETGERPATLRDIRDLCTIYNITNSAVRDDLNELARRARQRGWWQNYRDLGEVSMLIDLQTEASSISEHQSSMVPGLLQTAEYARAIIRGSLPRIREDVLAERTEARMVRQRLLESEEAPTFWAVLDEAVLHRHVGGRSVMEAQLEKLTSVADLSNVTIQVIKYEDGAHPGLLSNFTLLDFNEENLTPVVYVEQLSSDLYIENKSDIAPYREAVEHLRAMALSPKESRDLVKKIIERVL